MQYYFSLSLDSAKSNRKAHRAVASLCSLGFHFPAVKSAPCPGHVVDVYISQPGSWRLEDSSEAFFSLWNMVVKHPVIKPGNKATT